MCRKFVSERNGRPKYLIGEEGDAEANRILELCGGRAGQAINPPIPPPPQARDINTKIYKCAPSASPPARAPLTRPRVASRTCRSSLRA